MILPMNSLVTMPKQQWALWSQWIHLVDEVDDDEEYLKANPKLVPIFDINVMAILGEYEISITTMEKEKTDSYLVIV